MNLAHFGWIYVKESREDLKKEAVGVGGSDLRLRKEEREKIYEVGRGAIESQPNYNKYSDYLECPQCKKLYFV